MSARTAMSSRGAGGMSYAGFGTLLRLALRRDRVKLPAWLLGIAVAAFYFSYAIKTVYATPDDLKAMTGFLSGPAGAVMSGPGYGLDQPTHASVFAAVYTLYLYLAVAFMAILLVSRHTSAEEESGRLELVRAAEVGRNTPLAVAATLLTGASVLLGVLCALFVLPAGYGPGTWLFGASVTMIALVFGAAGLVTGQITEQSRPGTALAALVIAAALVIRGAGDALQTGGSWLSWLSPIAWAQQTRVYVDGRWWPLLLGVVLAVALFGVAHAIGTRRDLGAGLIRQRSGRTRAPVYLRGPIALAGHLERGAMSGWAAAAFVLGAAYGSLANSVSDSLPGSNNTLLVDALGGDPARLVDGYLAVCTMMTGYVALAYAIVAAHRLPAEERAGRTEIALAAGAGRVRLLLGGYLTALGGALAVLAAGGIGMGGTAWLVTGRAGYAADALLGAVYFLPAIAMLAGVAALGFAFRPGWLNLAWIAVAYSVIAGYLGLLLDLPSALVNLSPLSYVAEVPLEPQHPLPLVILTVIAATLVAAAAVRFRSRDLVTG